MQRVYCQSCGQPTEFTLKKPKCCSDCGTSFEAVATAAKLPVPANTDTLAALIEQAVAKRLNESQPAKKAKHVPKAQELEDEEAEIEVPHLEGTVDAWEITDVRPMRESIGAMVNTGNNVGQFTPLEDKKVKPLSKKALLEQFKNEAGSRQGNQSQEIGGSD